jgi:hypothetical protein
MGSIANAAAGAIDAPRLDRLATAIDVNAAPITTPLTTLKAPSVTVHPLDRMTDPPKAAGVI